MISLTTRGSFGPASRRPMLWRDERPRGAGTTTHDERRTEAGLTVVPGAAGSEDATVVVRIPTGSGAEEHARRDALLLGLFRPTGCRTTAGHVLQLPPNLAVSFLNGRLYVNPPSWLTEFALRRRWPMLLLIRSRPYSCSLAAIWGLTVNLAKVSIVVGACNVALMRIARRAARAAQHHQLCTHCCSASVRSTCSRPGTATPGCSRICSRSWRSRSAGSRRWAPNPVLLGLFCAIAADQPVARRARHADLLPDRPLSAPALRHRRPVPDFPSSPPACCSVSTALRDSATGSTTATCCQPGAAESEHGSFSWRYIPRNIQQLLPARAGAELELAVSDPDRPRLSLIATTPAVLLLFRRGWSERAPDANLYGRLPLLGCADLRASTSATSGTAGGSSAAATRSTSRLS